MEPFDESTPGSVIEEVEIDGKTIQMLIKERLLPALEGLPVGYALLSMLTTCVLIMKPDCEVEELKSAVHAASETLVLALADVSSKPAN